MNLHLAIARAHIAAVLILVLFPAAASTTTITGLIQATSPLGQSIALEITIDETTTTFELTGPGFSWYAWGFDPDQMAPATMMGYSLIVEGLQDSRTAHERNILGIGNPGDPQAMQNLTVVDTNYGMMTDLTTIVLQRPNVTGDPNDPDFSPSMTSLSVFWAYDSFATHEFPNGNLSYHGSQGRGIAEIVFTVVPEPDSLALCVIAAVATLMAIRPQRW